MKEFNSRIAAQRNILQICNKRQWQKEELLGMSKKAIQRWVVINKINPESNLVELITIASSKLFFLSNKSQEQISDQYNLIFSEIVNISEKIKEEVEKI